MPAESTETFYVEKVDKARVEKGPGGKKVWVFHTLWKGYPKSAASWVREDDFNGNYALDIFWKRSDVGDRDPNNLKKFTIGEVVHLREEEVPVKQKTGRRKAGPGQSSAALVSKVFALWPGDSFYYPATVQKRRGSQYLVRFMEDDTELLVGIADMFLCSELRAQDEILTTDDVNAVKRIAEDGTIVLRKEVKIEDIKLSSEHVKEQWKDRVLSHKDIICAH